MIGQFSALAAKFSLCHVNVFVNYLSSCKVVGVNSKFSLAVHATLDYYIVSVSHGALVTILYTTISYDFTSEDS